MHVSILGNSYMHIFFIAGSYFMIAEQATLAPASPDG
jgi:hypothetical protein